MPRPIISREKACERGAHTHVISRIGAWQCDRWEQHGVVAVFRGFGDGTFNPTPHLFFVPEPGSEAERPKPCFVAVGDMNNDGWQDIVASNNLSHTISVLLQIPDTECEPEP